MSAAAAVLGPAYGLGRADSQSVSKARLSGLTAFIELLSPSTTFLG